MFQADPDIVGSGFVDIVPVQVHEPATARVLVLASVATHPMPAGPADFSGPAAKLADIARLCPRLPCDPIDGIDRFAREFHDRKTEVQISHLFADLSDRNAISGGLRDPGDGGRNGASPTVFCIDPGTIRQDAAGRCTDFQSVSGIQQLTPR